MTHSVVATNCLDVLATRLGELLSFLETSAVYRRVFAEPADPALVTALMRHVYWEIASYQPHVTEATFTAVGRMPKHEGLMKLMILQQVEEVEHAAMALRDYRRLGGTGEPDGRLSPASAAVAAVCRFLGEHCHPASYLGYMYLFEALTPIMASRVQSVMDETGYHSAAREFVDLHATEDIRHTDQVAGMIDGLLAVEPAAAAHVVWGFDAFAAVYPLPVWEEAARRASCECEAPNTVDV